MGERLLLIGGGGHCRSIIDSLDMEKYTSIKILDNAPLLSNIAGIDVICSDEDAPKLFKEGFTSAVISLGSIGNPSTRIKLYHKYNEIGFEFPAIIDPTAVVSNRATIGKGVFIGKGAIINTDCHIGNCAIVNSGAVIDHECNIGEFVHIAPNVSLSGGVSIGNNSHIGVGSTIIQYTNVGENTIIGAGSVVTKDMPSGVIGVGVPCRIVSEL